MCYAIPGKVEQIQGKTVIVDYFGEKKKAYNETEGLCPGDYIYAQGGYVIEKVPRDDALQILSMWKEAFFRLQKTDLLLSKIDIDPDFTDKKLLRILDRAMQRVKLTKAELSYLMDLEEEQALEALYKTANFLRFKYHRNACCVHGIIEISNWCRKDCAYCGISLHNSNLKRYRMNKQEIMDAVYQAVEVNKFKALVLQSGEDTGYSTKELSAIIREIKEKFAVLIFITFGEVGIDSLQELFSAGARGLLLRFETSNPDLYHNFCPAGNWQVRMEHIKAAYKMGYLIATGGLIGLPGQSRQDIINDILLAKELSAEMFSFGPFMPHPDTPLGRNQPPLEKEVLKTLALSRLIDAENAKILVTTAFETLSPNARQKGLMAGASSFMLNATPQKYRNLYSIYPNKAHNNEDLSFQIQETISLLQSLGRAPAD
ncbi:MAG: [FeFe] hydrogenase H-cluster radical SAM maturase HydE, partial [Deltaproteobacteria bacterium]